MFFVGVRKYKIVYPALYRRVENIKQIFLYLFAVVAAVYQKAEIVGFDKGTISRTDVDKTDVIPHVLVVDFSVFRIRLDVRTVIFFASASACECGKANGCRNYSH